MLARNFIADASIDSEDTAFLPGYQVHAYQADMFRIV